VGTQRLTGASADQPISELSVGDLTRLLVLLEEAQRTRKMTAPELEALCYLVATERDQSGAIKWPRLGFAYRFQFSPTPGSDELYDDLLQLEHASLVRRRSPVEITQRGQDWLKQPRYDEAVAEIRREARAAAEAYASKPNLVELSVERGAAQIASTGTRKQEPSSG